MIVFGTRSIVSTKEQGTFFCPLCSSLTPYLRKVERNFVTIYFVPLIPFRTIEQYIECQRCGQMFPPTVLDPHSPRQTQYQAEFQNAVKNLMILMMVADDKTSDAEIELIQSRYRDIAHETLSRQSIIDSSETISDEMESVLSYILKVKATLNDVGKEYIVSAAASVALADGVLTEAEDALLQRVKTAVNMSDVHLKGVLVDIGGDKFLSSATLAAGADTLKLR